MLTLKINLNTVLFGLDSVSKSSRWIPIPLKTSFGTKLRTKWSSMTVKSLSKILNKPHWRRNHLQQNSKEIWQSRITKINLKYLDNNLDPSTPHSQLSNWCIKQYWSKKLTRSLEKEHSPIKITWVVESNNAKAFSTFSVNKGQINLMMGFSLKLPEDYSLP